MVDMRMRVRAGVCRMCDSDKGRLGGELAKAVYQSVDLFQKTPAPLKSQL